MTQPTVSLLVLSLSKISIPGASDEDSLIGYLILSQTQSDTSNASKIPVFAQRDPAKIPWGKYDVEVVIESTGAFTSEEKANAHLAGGAKQVVISAPARGGNVPTSVIGVNEDKIVAADHQNTIQVLNNASCTTNCVAPVAIVIQNRLGIAKAAMTTIHSYTDDQNLQDASHKDLRARAAAQNSPTSTEQLLLQKLSRLGSSLWYCTRSPPSPAL
jgi:glyceraldehyde 3-phosphate dehydrogenase